MSLNQDNQNKLWDLMGELNAKHSVPEQLDTGNRLLAYVEAIAAAAFEAGVEATADREWRIEAAKRANPYGIALNLVDEFRESPAQFVLKTIYCDECNHPKSYHFAGTGPGRFGFGCSMGGSSTKSGKNCTCERIFS